MNSRKPNPYPFAGLSSEEAGRRLIQNGNPDGRQNVWQETWAITRDLVAEPMFLLLVACASIYFVLGETAEAWFMSGAIVVVSAISFYQEIRQKNALKALKEYTREKQKVIRDNKIVEIATEHIVPGDLVICAEGDLIPADGNLLFNPDFSVNESLLTGESLPVYKDKNSPELSTVFQGSMVTSGQCIFEVTATGISTRLGQMGAKMDEMKFKKSPLAIEISSFVTKMAGIGALFFIFICIISFLKSGDWAESLLAGLTIAMSVLPEEIPVAYTTFMALGAWRLIKDGIIVKKTDIVEALGNTKYLCLDKTGTITQNKMELVSMYDFAARRTVDNTHFHEATDILETAMWASESEPFDPMEKSIHHFYKKNAPADERTAFKMIFEYPLGGTPPTMTHVFSNLSGKTHVAMKGAPEAVLAYCNVSPEDQFRVRKEMDDMAALGYRVLGVAKARDIPDTMPEKQGDFDFIFLGLIAFFDPPKHNIDRFFKKMDKAGVQLKIITGDHKKTAVRIAETSGFKHATKAIDQNELEKADEKTFEEMVLSHNIFARISPEYKLRIIRVLEKQGIVAMTGDGVNDGLALKAANVGIAMGKKGTEIARLASSIVLTDDNIEKIADSVEMGRKIYTNLQKAIRYIISIHVPIILVVSVPLFLGWEYASIFSPVHIIFLELLMGPTCSVVYENEPPEKGIMDRDPMSRTGGFISWQKISISIFQGLVITLFALGMYTWGLQTGLEGATIRTMVFLLLISANILLTLTNRSFTYSLFTMLRVKNHLMTWILGLTVLLTAAILMIPPVRHFFELTELTWQQTLLSVAGGLLSVIWFEVYKWQKRSR